ncbi:hypothetical protein CTI12_AA581690 [Artemisia annua]|uniref:Zinc knuckle CX2CX4HX4C n=1 Tax=Artemisia annua TaxID=35608 RepID=A0A2U1KQ63_ARTAN|nr:hypothetical protein CTI12_AA581690 [Artemisia annua]
MDRMTTLICEKPFGRASFARVLVEIDSSRTLVDNVELWYEKLGKVLRIRVEYTWVPPRCKECKVFGHYWNDCVKKVNTVSKVNKDGENVKDAGVTLNKSNGENDNGDGDEGWQIAGNRRNMRNVGYNTHQGSYEKLGKVLRIRVEYTWVPPRCKECKVFGHYWNDCVKKVNTVSKVNKDGENVKDVGVTLNKSNGENDNGDGEEGWQIAGNRRNMRNVDYNTRQGSVGGYNAKRGSYNDKGSGNNRINVNVGGARNVQKKAEPVNNGKSTNGDLKLNVAKKSSCNKNGNGSTNGKNNMGSNSSDRLSTKKLGGDKPVVTSNRFDLLREEGVSDSIDPWKVVKELVVVACSTNVPIDKDILKGWNDEMVKFYTVKWNNRASKSGSIKLQLETEMKSLVHQIVQLNRNLNMNAKVNAEKMLKSSDVNNQSSSGVSLSSSSFLIFDRTFDIRMIRVCWFCLGTGFWKCNQVFDRGTDSKFCAGRLYCLWRWYYVIDWGDDCSYNQLCTTEFGLASALACILVDWIIACYALQNRVRNSALAVLFYVGFEFGNRLGYGIVISIHIVAMILYD